MSWQATPYTILLILAAVASAGSAIYTFWRYGVPGRKTVVIAALAGSGWMLGYAFELGSTSLQAKDFWNKVQYLGIVTVPTALFIFALLYTGRRRLVRVRSVLLLGIEPLIILFLVFTNEAHGLIWERPLTGTAAPLTLLARSHGIGYFIHTVYSYALGLTTIYLLIQVLVRSHQIRRRQAGAFMFAMSTALLGSIIMQLDLGLPPYLDLTPMAFTLASLIVTWSLPRLRIVDIVPAAQWAVIDNMDDGVIVLDDKNRIADLNRAAKRVIDRPDPEIIGQPVEQVWDKWPFHSPYSDVPDPVQEVTIRRGREVHIYDVHLSPLFDWRHRIVGQVIVLHDLTELKQRTLELSTLLEASRAPSSTLDLETVLSLIAGQMVQAMGVDGCTLSRWNQESDTVVTWIEQRRQSREPSDEPGTAYPLADFPATRTVLETHQPLTVHISAPDADPAEAAILQKIGSTSLLMLPLVIGDRTIGLVELDQADHRREFTLDEIRLCQALADQAAVIIDNARLYEEAQRRARQFAALNKTGQAIASSLDLDVVLNLAMNEVMSVLDAEGASAILHDPTTDELEFVIITGPASEALTGARMPSTEGIAGWVFQESQPLLVRDAQSDPRLYRQVDSTTGMTTRSLLAAPLVSKDKVIGVIEAINKTSGHFDEHDLELLITLADSAAVAIENARLYEQLRRQAEELAAAVTRLQELDRLKSEFIQNVSHELRTPLALMRGFAEVLNSGQLGELRPEQRRPVSIIARRAHLLAELVGDITLIMEAETDRPDPAPVPLDELTREALEGLQARAAQAGLTIDAHIPPDLPPVSGYATYVRRVLDHLLGNALKFTPQGGSVTITLRQEPGMIALEVSDTGIGIPEHQLGRIFDRFYQVDGSTKRRYGGTGLGLALVKNLVDAYGGQVTVCSQIGAGSTFTMTLPIYEG